MASNNRTQPKLNNTQPRFGINTQPRFGNNNNAQPRLNNSGVLQKAKNLSPITIFIIVLILLILIYIMVNYLYSVIVQARPVKVSENVLVDVPIDGMAQLEIGSSELPHSSYSNEYSLSLWVYVDNFDYKHGERKVLLRRGDIRETVNPEIYIHPTQNTLQVNVSLATDIHGTPATETTTTTTTTTAAATATTTTEPFEDIRELPNPRKFEDLNISTVSDEKFIHNIANHYDNDFYNRVVNTNEIDYLSQPGTMVALQHSPELDVVVEQFGNQDGDCDCDNSSRTGETAADRTEFEDKAGKCLVPHFPLQKWVHLVVSQYNNVMDIYLDGKLHSSCVLQGFPDVSTGNLVLSPEGGFSGQMNSVVYYNSALAQDDVYKIYSKGPNGSRHTGIVSRLRAIPTWVYVVVAVFIVALVAYSFVM